MTGLNNKNKKITIAVIICGGKKSFNPNESQYIFLKKQLIDFVLCKYNLNLIGINKLLGDYKKGKFDIVLKNSYGRMHEIWIEELLQKNSVPFIGSNSKSVYLGTSKYLTKNLLRKHKLPVLPQVFINKNRWLKHQTQYIKEIINKIGFPCILKNDTGTDSRGILISKNEGLLKKYLNQLFNYGVADVIIEKFLHNAYELTCLCAGTPQKIYEPVGMGFVGNLHIPMNKDKQRYKPMLPVQLNRYTLARIKSISLKAHKALKCKDFSRVDLLVNNGRIFIIEVDVHPGFREISPTTLSINFIGQTLNDFFKILSTNNLKHHESK
jgi:D-alanine-D-alanine ligase